MSTITVQGAMTYSCPACYASPRQSAMLHDLDCKFEQKSAQEIEAAYYLVLGYLTAEPHTKDDLEDAIPSPWMPLHEGVLNRLLSEDRADETQGEIELKPPGKYWEDRKRPSYPELKTIYDQGSVPGCHDNAVFALVAYYEMIGVSWSETKSLVVEWLRNSGAWSRGGFEETTPEDVVENKRHIYESGYGWKEAATEAAGVIQNAAPGTEASATRGEGG